jgi:hypothetical protein
MERKFCAQTYNVLLTAFLTLISEQCPPVSIDSEGGTNHKQNKG